jgi:hypothetical protein
MSEQATAIRPRFRRNTVLTLVVAAIGLAGVLIKTPFGNYITALAGHQTSVQMAHGWDDWLLRTEYGRIALGTLACLLIALPSETRVAPVLERLLFRDRTIAKTKIWLPAALGALALTACFLIVHFAFPSSGGALGGSGPHQPTADQMKHLALLWPLGFIGAGMSEEVSFRYVLIGPVVGLVYLLSRGNNRAGEVAFWIANIGQALFFGYGHVSSGVVASAEHGLLLGTLLAPQTWGGLVLGYIYRRFGIEAAIVSHMMSDFLVPMIVVLLPLLK